MPESPVSARKPTTYPGGSTNPAGVAAKLGTALALAFAVASGPTSAKAAAIAVTNPGFESPVLPGLPGASFSAGLSGWTASGGVGTSYQEPAYAASPAPEGTQYALADQNGFEISQVTAETLDVTKSYTFTIDVFPLQVNAANNLEVAVDLYDTAFSAHTRQAYVVYHASFLPDQEDFDLVPLAWNRVQVRFSGADFPTFAGRTMRLRATGRRCALDRARFERYAAGEHPAAGGTTYYVSESLGDDTNSGTSPADPWETFDNANVRLLAPGDKVLLRRGDTWNTELHLKGTGSPANPVELGAWGDPTLPRPSIALSDPVDGKCVVIQQPSYWKIRDLDCRGGKLGVYLRYQNSWDNRSVEIADCNFQDMPDQTLEPAAHQYEYAWSDGIFLGGHVWNSVRYNSTVLDGLTIRGCTFRGVAHGFGTGWYYPPSYKGRIRNFVMSDCAGVDCFQGPFALIDVTSGTIDRVDGHAGGSDSWAGSTLGFLQSCSQVQVRDCTFGYCDRRESGDGVGFDFEGDTDNCGLYDCTFHNNSGSGVIILSTNGPCLATTINRCTFYRNCLNPWNSEINSEITCGFSGNTGSVTNCGFARRDASVNFVSPSNFGGFTFSGNRNTTHDPAREKRWWNFDTPGNLEGWNGFNDWVTPTVAGGALTGASSTGFDPYAQSPATWVNTRLQPYLWLRMTHTQGAFAQFLYTTDADPSWSGDKLITVPVIDDGLARDYWVDLRGGNFKGLVTQVRIDPPFQPAAAPLIDHIRLTGSVDPAQSAPVDPAPLPTEATFVSIAAEDGQVLESAAGSGVGGSNSAGGNTIPLGDTATNQRSRMIFSFDTSALPDNAVVVEAQLRMTRTGVTGSDPWTFGGSLVTGGYGYADISSQFGVSAGLENGDFQAASAGDKAAKFIVPYSNGLAVMDLLSTPSLPQINLTGRTQFRVYMEPGTDNDNGEDTVAVGSGSNGTASNRPQLKVRYYVATAPAAVPQPDFRDGFTPPLQVPRAPVVGGAQTNSLTVSVPGDTNPGATAYALRVVNLGQWVQADGTLGASPVWRTAAQWGTVTVSGLPRSATHNFRTRARRADATGETVEGPPGSLATTPVAVSGFVLE